MRTPPEEKMQSGGGDHHIVRKVRRTTGPIPPGSLEAMAALQGDATKAAAPSDLKKRDMVSRLRAPSLYAASWDSGYALPKFAHATPPAPMDFSTSPTPLAAAGQCNQHQYDCCTFLLQKLHWLLQLLQQLLDASWMEPTAAVASVCVAAIATTRPPSAFALADITSSTFSHLGQQHQQQLQRKQQQQFTMTLQGRRAGTACWLTGVVARVNPGPAADPPTVASPPSIG